MMTAWLKTDYEAMSDADLAVCIAARDPEAVRLVTKRNNQRLFRVAWSILKDRQEAEDAVQTAYLKAFAAIDGFKADAALSTWLTRILINEALERRRKKERDLKRAGDGVVMMDQYREKMTAGSQAPSQDAALALAEIRRLMEAAISRLPDPFRLVFILREIEGVDVEESAALLGIPPATVKTRLLRARRRLQADLGPELRSVLDGAFPFAGADCEALTERTVAAFCG
jgi:RNA polymerase sigma-70 factor (ECF subfamily)